MVLESKGGSCGSIESVKGIERGNPWRGCEHLADTRDFGRTPMANSPYFRWT